MRKNTVFILILTLSIILSFSACNSKKSNPVNSSNEKTTETTIKHYDEDFLSDFKKGLQARWDIILDNEDDPNYLPKLKEGINAELDLLSPYSDLTFNDNKLKEKAITYINFLNQQLDALNYVNNDIFKYSEMWEEAYNGRSKIINELVTDYNIVFDDKYKDDVDNLISNSKAVEEQEKTNKKVQEMLDSIDFKISDNSYGWKTYSAVVENTAGIDFESIFFNINLLDKDDVIVSSTSAVVNNWAKGKKAKIEFSTDKSFTSTEITAQY